MRGRQEGRLSHRFLGIPPRKRFGAGLSPPRRAPAAHPTRPPAAGIARCPTQCGAGAGGAGAGLEDPAGQRRAGGAAPRGSARVWPLAAVFTEMSVRRMAAERWAEGPPSDLGKARWAPPARSGRPGGDPPAGPGLFVFRRSQSCISLSFFWLPHHSGSPAAPSPATQAGSLHLRMRLSAFCKRRAGRAALIFSGRGGAGREAIPPKSVLDSMPDPPAPSHRFGSTVPSALAVLRGPSSGAVCAFCILFMLAFVFVFLFLLSWVDDFTAEPEHSSSPGWLLS